MTTNMNITMLIEKMAKDGSYFDAVLELAEQLHCDPEDIIESISPVLLAKIKQECYDKKYVKSDLPSRDITLFLES